MIDLKEVKNMKKHFMIITLIAAFMVFGGFAIAQHGGGMQSPGTGKQQMMGQGMADHMAMMACMMDDMHRMMVHGQMNGEHHKQMMDMMSRMGHMMEQIL
jgi:hypothetical protein